MKHNSCHLGDCLQIMPDIPDKSIDMILCDLPYGTTEISWDKCLDLEVLFKEYKRLIKDNGSIVLCGNQPFTSDLVIAGKDIFKYSLVWQKSRITRHTQANFRILPIHEDVLIFGKYGCSSNSKILPKFNILAEKQYKKHKITNKTNFRPGRTITTVNYISLHKNYQKSILPFKNEQNKYHPTQKPAALFEYLIKTYTNEGDLVLDNCAGSFTTAIACINTNRNYICIEKEQEYFNRGQERIREHLDKMKQDLFERENIHA